jgi:peptidoglycan/xylan/chitin deacetylase (PgdA/CDA1 family)
VLTDAASILREFQIPWTVFVVSDWSSHKNPWAANNILHWQALERVQDWGGEIGSHSVSHPDFARLTPPEIDMSSTSRAMRSRRSSARRRSTSPSSMANP